MNNKEANGSIQQFANVNNSIPRGDVAGNTPHTTIQVAKYPNTN